MDGVQLQRLVQDENASLGVHNNKPGLQQQSGLKPGPLSSRKAFGNITNKAQQQDSGNGAEPSAAKPRRAFGELSVNRPTQLQAQQQSDGGKPTALKPARQAFAQVQQQAQQSVAVQQQQTDLASVYAAGGIEKYAGRTWQQLEEEREAAEEASVASAARHLATRLAGWRVGSGALKIAADEDDEEETNLLAPQPRPSVSAVPVATSSAAVDPIAILMGDDELFGSSGSGCPLDLLPDVTESDGLGTTPAAAGVPPERQEGVAQPFASPESQPW